MIRMIEKDEHTYEAARTCKPMVPMDSLTRFSTEIVSILVKEAVEALNMPDNNGLAFAALLMDDALKYDSIYPRARGAGDDSMISAANKIRNWYAVENVDRKFT